MAEIIVKSRFESLKIPDNRTISEFILEKAKEYGDRVSGIEPHSGRECTYSELIDRVKRAASAFSRRGMRKGDIVLIISPNDIDFGVAFLALASLGAITTTANPASTARELKAKLTDFDASYVITTAVLSAKVKELTEQFATIREIFTFGQAEGFTPLADLMTEDIDVQALENVNLNPDDVIILAYSSGTTGVPKGVMMSHRMIISCIIMICTPELSIMSLDGCENYILSFPIYHMYGMVVMFLQSLFTGNSLVYMRDFNFEEYLSLIQKYKVPVLHTIPPVVVLLAKHPIVDNYDFSRLHTIFCATASVGKEMEESVMSRLGIDRVYQGFGLSEALVSHLSPISGYKQGSVGELLPNVEGKVVDVDSGRDLGPNQRGEMWLRSPSHMKGYYKNPDATSHTIDKAGWIHTGDVCFYDEDNFFFVVDRLKELIKYNGVQVPPAELEALLLTHPGVADAAVIGVPDEMAGELPMAFIVKKAGSGVTEEDIVTFVEEEVSPPKRLRGGVKFVDTIPKSPTGKILRRILRESIV